MAERALMKLEEELNCSICLETYNNPKQLQCNHIYCKGCLVRLVDRDEEGQLSIACPACRQPTAVPARGVSGLSSAFHINHLLDIQDSVRELKSSLTSPRGNKDLTLGLASCSVHAKEELKLYCETCNQIICLKCALKDNRHHTHNYKELDLAFKEYKDEVALLLDSMKMQLMEVTRARIQLDIRRQEITNQQEHVQTNIQQSFQQLYEILNSRNKELVGQLEQITQEKLKSLDTQREQMEVTQTHLASCITAMKDILDGKNPREKLMERTGGPQWKKKNDELDATLTQENLKPVAVADLTFNASPDMTSACQNYGLVLASTLPYPPKCHATGKGLEVAVVGAKSTASLQSINFECKPCDLPESSLECELVSEITGGRIEKQGFDIRKRQSQHLISYQPKVKGNHQLHIRVDGQDIKGSPFNVVAKSPVENLGATILTIEKLDAPRGEAIDQSNGRLVVTEYSSHRVSVFSPSGKKLMTFGSHGSSPGQFKYPRGVTLDTEGSILVADSGNHRIQKFTPKGQFISTVGVGGSGPLQFKWPDGIAFSAANSKIYVSDDNHRIQILNSDLTFSKIFGKEGSSRGQFCYPSGIACDGAGEVYVADSNNHRIQVFSAEGKFLRTFGRQGMKSGELTWPVGVAISETSGLVYVSENSNRISVFTLEGLFVMSFGQEGEECGQFNHPYGVAVHANGVVYVCDTDNNRVQVF